MPEYLAPGVFVEEVSYRSKSIEGVSTTTTGFVGPTRSGPDRGPLEVLTSLRAFQAIYGDGENLKFGSGGTTVDRPNYMWHAARAFFEEGGKRLYVSRAVSGSTPPTVATLDVSTTSKKFTVSARYPGAAGNARVQFTFTAGDNILAVQNGANRLRGISEHDLVLVDRDAAATVKYELGIAVRKVVDGKETWEFEIVPTPTAPTGGGGGGGGGGAPPPAPEKFIKASGLKPSEGDQVRVVTVTVGVAPNRPGATWQTWAGIPPDPRHRLGGAPDSLTGVFGDNAPPDVPLVIKAAAGATAYDLITGLDDSSKTLEGAITANTPTSIRMKEIELTSGTDGAAPIAGDYAGDAGSSVKRGLIALEDIEDISIVAAPGATASYADADKSNTHAVINALITHADRMRYRIAVIDAPKGLTPIGAKAVEAQHDSKYAAFYYPWVKIVDPLTGLPVDMPPSGFVAGIYARNDVQRAVYKAPANEVVNLAIGFERLVNRGEQEVLNPEGVNCFRFFPGRGYRLWGARTMSSDPEWKYVNLRRYFAFLEHSIDRGTQWAVFEPNGEALWANVRRTIDDFLFDQWQNGALLGDKPEKAYFVRCDRSIMSQNDLDNGRLVCQIGVAPLRPAEFVIFRIGQWTADRKA